MSFSGRTLRAGDFLNRIFDRNGKMGRDACEILAAALHAVNPYQCIQDCVRWVDDHLIINQQTIHLNDINRVFVIGFGKASVPMAGALIDLIEDRITSANVITKDSSFLNEEGFGKRLKIYQGGHPFPDENSIASTRSLLESLPRFTDQDLVLIVISGGGSALFTAPMPGISLPQLRKTTELLLKCGADIQEINTIRKHLDLVKGGRFAQMLQPARIHALILSDVIGDRLDMIASGPTSPDPTTYQDAIDVIERYHLRGKIPRPILRILESGVTGEIKETLKPGWLPKGSVHHHLVGTNLKAVQAARLKAESLGYHCQIISKHLTGLTTQVADQMEEIIQGVLTNDEPVEHPICLLFGGETTVQVTGSGLGGRNQDLVLRMVPKLAGKQDILFVSLATDGEDGPTDAAGAASDAEILREGAVGLGLDVHTDIANNNSYRYLNEIGALIKTGSTGTNVNDLIIILTKKSRL